MDTLATCVCGCDAPWTDPDSDDYLFSHFECEGCGSDWPVDTDLVVTEYWTEYNDTLTVYYCRDCVAADATDRTGDYLKDEKEE